jgi:hypothetical protein
VFVVARYETEQITEEENGTRVNGSVVYSTAVEELRELVDSEGYRRKVETPLREARGQDVFALHAMLKAVEAAHRDLAEALRRIQAELDVRSKDTNANIDRTRDQVSSEVASFRDDVGAQFTRTWDSLAQNFELTNERTRREIFDLRDEVTRILDRRFTHVDQTFASIRGDIEILKALQMELIKERIGRPEIVKR